jgi:hypothetical protein
MRSMPRDARIPISLLIERVLSVMIFLSLICLCVGFVLYLIGVFSNVLIVIKIGVDLLLVGVALIALRIFFWIMEEIVDRGVKSMTTD